MSREEILLTGATGYIGAALAADLLRRTEATVHLLAREKREAAPDERVARALDPLLPPPGLGAFEGRVRVVRGDVAEDGCGLSDRDCAALAERVTTIVHGAAAARFDLDLDAARKTNVGGVKNVLELARSCRRLRRVVHLSTAYVAGTRTDLVREGDLAEGTEHRNTYERSKFEGERLARASMGELPVTILRPSIVICDSRTGRISPYNGFTRALTLLLRGFLEAIPGEPSTLVDLVPLDTVVEAAQVLSVDPDAVGKTYHLTAGPERATSLGTIRDLASGELGGAKLPFLAPECFSSLLRARALRLDEQRRKMAEEVLLYLPYLSSSTFFDNSGMRAATGLEVPRFESYFGRMWEHVAALRAG